MRLSQLVHCKNCKLERNVSDMIYKPHRGRGWYITI